MIRWARLGVAMMDAMEPHTTHSGCVYDEDGTDEEEIKMQGLFDDDHHKLVYDYHDDRQILEDFTTVDHEEMMVMNMLPPEIHYLILTFVDFRTLLVCQLVSKQWYEFSIRSEIWLPFYGNINVGKAFTIQDIPQGANSHNGQLTVNDFTIYDKDGVALVPRQQHLSEEYLSWMLQERQIENTPNYTGDQLIMDKCNVKSDDPCFRSLFINKAVHKYEKKLRRKDLIEMYNTLNDLVQYIPPLKKVCYIFFFIGTLLFSLIMPLLLDHEGKLKEIEYLEKYYTIYVMVCYGPVIFCHSCCLLFCYYVYRTHLNISYHDQNERLLIFSMTNVTSYLLDVTFETQLLCTIPLTFCIPIIMHIFDWGHTVSMLPVVINIVIQKLFYFIYEVQREKILRRKKWESLRSVNTALLFQISLICFKLDKMLVLRYIFGDIVMNLTWSMAFIPAYIFGFIYCTQNFHQLQKSHWLVFKRTHTFFTRKFVMFIVCLVLYQIFFCLLGIKLEKPEKLDYSFLYIFLYWYAANVGVYMLKMDRIHSHLFL